MSELTECHGPWPTATRLHVLYFDFLAPYVLLDRLGVGDHVLADTHLFFGYRSLLHYDLFLGDGNPYLVLADLGLRSLALHGHPLHAYFLMAGGHFYLLAVRAHALSDLELASLALTGTCGELLLTPLHPELVLVGQVIAMALVYSLIVGGVLAELAGLGVAHSHARSG